MSPSDCVRARGVAGTTLEDVADAAGVDEGNLRACLVDMEGLMAALVTPFLERLEPVAARAAAVDLGQEQAIREVIDAYLDAILDHRSVAGVVLSDPTAASTEPARRVRALTMAIRDHLAGGLSADLDGTIRATSALGALQFAALERSDLERHILFHTLTEAAVAILLPGPDEEAGI